MYCCIFEGFVGLGWQYLPHLLQISKNFSVEVGT